MRNEVWPQQLGLGLSICLAHLDPGFGHRPRLERMSQRDIESSPLETLVNEHSDSCRFQDEIRILEPVEGPIELFVRRREPPRWKVLVPTHHYTCQTERFCTSGSTYSIASCLIVVLTSNDIGGGSLHHNIHKDGSAIAGTRKRSEACSSCPMS